MKLTATILAAALLAPAAFSQTAPVPDPAASTPQTKVVSGPLTFREALTRALEVNNDIERAQAGVGVAEANRKYLLSAVLPRVNLTGSTIRNSDQVSFGNGADARTILAQNDWNYHVILSQPIYAGNRERRAYEQSKLGVVNARTGEQQATDAVLLRVSSYYLAMVNAEALIAIERRNIELATKRKAQATAFYQAGEATKVDELRAETAIKSAQRALALAEQQRDTAEGFLRADLDLEGHIAVVRPDSILPSMPDEVTLVRRAETDRPDVRIAATNEQIAQLEVRKQRGFWLPVVTFDGGLNAQKAAFPASRYSYGALRFSVPLFQSGEVQARVAGAKEQELQARLALEQARLNAREDVRKALVDYQSAATSLQLARDQQAAAEAEYAQEFELYRAQEATSLDLAASELSLAEAQRAVAEEELNRALASLRVWYASGALPEALGVADVIPGAQPAPAPTPVNPPAAAPAPASSK